MPFHFDAIVSKLNPAGSALVYSTYLGGGSEDYGTSIDLDGSGSACVTGSTRSANFPSTPGTLQPTHGGGSDAFVVKLSPAGTSLVYSTFLGGSADDVGGGVAVDGSGSAYVGGSTHSANFPTRAPLQAANAGDSDAFVAKLNPSGSGLV